MGLSFTFSAGDRQRSHTRVRVPWDSRPYFSVSDSRPVSSPPTTRMATVEVFSTASTRQAPPPPNALSMSLMLRPTVSRPVCLGTKHPFGAYDRILIIV
jgi:hypothetical protein